MGEGGKEMDKKIDLRVAICGDGPHVHDAARRMMGAYGQERGIHFLMYSLIC